MIRTRKLTPDVYYRQSRDFQFIGRLYDMVFNSVKTNSDLIYSLPNSEDADTAFLDLLSTTLGFKSKHNYNVAQLKSLCACFAEVIRNKGNMTSILKACNALIGAEGITESVYIDDRDFKSGIVIYISETLSDVNLLRDLLDYILPAGLSYSIVKTLVTEKSVESKTAVASSVKIGTKRANVVSLMPSATTDEPAPYFVADTLEGANVFETAGMLMNATVVDEVISDESEEIAEKTYPQQSTDEANAEEEGGE